MSVPAGTRFIGIQPGVDMVERKSSQANSPTEVYTIDDINQDLQSVTNVGSTTTNTIVVGDLSTSYSEIGNGAVGTENVNNGTYAYIGQDGILGLHNGDVESQLKNTDVSAGNSVVLEFPDKTSGSYTIATLDDIPSTLNYGLFAQTANSTIITNTTTETSLINGGVGTLSVPANGFQVGDSFRAVFGGVMNANNNQTIRIRVRTGGILLLDSGLQNLGSSVINDIWSLNIDFTIRQIGAAGVASIVSLGAFHYTKTNNASVQGFGFNVVNNTTFDTTISNTLDVTAQWGSASTGNNIYSDIFMLNKTY